MPHHLISCGVGRQIARLNMLQFVGKTLPVVKWQPNYSMFTMNTKGEAGSQQQPNFVWAKLKVNSRREHRVITGFSANKWAGCRGDSPRDTFVVDTADIFSRFQGFYGTACLLLCNKCGKITAGLPSLLRLCTRLTYSKSRGTLWIVFENQKAETCKNRCYTDLLYYMYRV